MNGGRLVSWRVGLENEHNKIVTEPTALTEQDCIVQNIFFFFNSLLAYRINLWRGHEPSP